MTIDGLIEKVEKLSKAPAALRTIGEVADILSVEQHVLRFWESKFEQIKPHKNRGIRYYTMQDIELLSKIKTWLYDEGYTIKGVQLLLSKKRGKSVSCAKDQDLSQNIIIPREQLTLIISQLKSIRGKLIKGV